MDYIGKDGKLLPLLDIVLRPLISELVAGFLPCHALLYPLFAAPMFLPGLTSTIQRQRWISHSQLKKLSELFNELRAFLLLEQF